MDAARVGLVTSLAARAYPGTRASGIRQSGQQELWLMCGIVAYVGRKVCQPLLIEGLKRLEYRGYDSAGIAVIDDAGRMHIRRAVGRISVLEDKIEAEAPQLPPARLGMAHTRWATHGAP